MKEWGDALTLSYELVLPTLLGALIGYYIDQYFASFPLALAIGLFLGAAAGFYNVVRKYIIPLDKKEKR